MKIASVFLLTISVLFVNRAAAGTPNTEAKSPTAISLGSWNPTSLNTFSSSGKPGVTVSTGFDVNRPLYLPRNYTAPNGAGAGR